MNAINLTVFLFRALVPTENHPMEEMLNWSPKTCSPTTCDLSLDSLEERIYPPDCLEEAHLSLKPVAADPQAAKSSDLTQGTLEMLILKTLAMEPMHGYGVGLRIEQIS